MNNIQIIEKKLNMRKNEFKTKTSFGSAFKTFRKENNLTLEEAAADICSVSYLSKAENNLINISEVYSKKLNERYNLNFLNEEKLAEYYDWLKIVSNLLVFNKKIDFEHFKTTSVDHQALLIKYIKQVTLKDNDKAYETFTELIHYLDLFHDLELDIFKYLTAVLFVEKKQYLALTKIISLINKSSNKDNLINVKTNVFYLKALTEIRNHRVFEQVYDKLVISLIDYQLFDDISEVKKLQLDVLLYHLSTEEFIIKVENNKNLLQVYKQYYLAKHYYFIGEYNNAKKHSYDHKNHEELYLLDIMIDAKLNVYQKEYISFKGKTDFFNHIVISFLTVMSESKEKALLFVKENILTLSALTDSGFYLDFIYSESVDLLMENNMYKDAQRLTKQRNILLKEML